MVLALAAAPASPDQPADGAPQVPEIFSHEIEVRVINLEVRVTDRQGRHIPGLGSGDFELLIDGVEQRIDYFSEIRERQAVGESGAAAIPSAIGPGERVRNSFLLFIDNDFSEPHDRQRVLEALRAAVHSLQPGDQMAVVSYDGSRLVKMGDWADSPAALEAALDRALALPAHGLRRRAAISTLDRQRARQSLEGDDSGDLRSTGVYIRDLSRRIERALRAATSTLRGFAAPAGRKVMLLASGGWPKDPSASAVGFDPQVRLQTRFAFPDAAFEELIGTANLLGYTLYPIDVPGNEVGVRGVSAANRRSGLPGFDSEANTRAGSSLSITAGSFLTGGLGIDPVTNREIENEATLIELARRTGGRPLINSGRLVAIEEVLADTSSFYWLGFTRDRQHDDVEHEIEIEVARHGAQVRARRGFRDLSRRQEVAMQIESHLLFDTEGGKELLQVELGRPRVRRRVRQPVILRVPLDAIVMTPTAGGFAAQLELTVASIDADGARSPLPTVPVRIDGRKPPQPGQVAVVEVVLQLRKVSQKLLLGLHDLAGDALLTATVEFEPPASP